MANSFTGTFSTPAKEAAFLSVTNSIPDPTTLFQGGFFENEKNLLSITIPDVIAVGDFAFKGCYKLSVIDLPNVDKIGDEAFLACDLKIVNVPKLTMINGDPFAGINNDKSTIFALGDNYKNKIGIAFPIFINNSIIDKITFVHTYKFEHTPIAPYGNSYIGAFLDKDSEKDFNEIGSQSLVNNFSSEPLIKEINLPEIKIAPNNFFGVSNIKKFDAPNMFETGNNFLNSNAIKKYSFPNLFIIGKESLSGLSVNDISMPKLTGLEDKSILNFFGESLSMDSIEFIGSDCLSNAPVLKSISMPALKFMDATALSNAVFLQKVLLPNLTSTSSVGSANLFVNSKVTILIIPSFLVSQSDVANAFGIFNIDNKQYVNVTINKTQNTPDKKDILFGIGGWDKINFTYVSIDKKSNESPLLHTPNTWKISSDDYEKCGWGTAIGKFKVPKSFINRFRLRTDSKGIPEYIYDKFGNLVLNHLFDSNNIHPEDIFFKEKAFNEIATTFINAIVASYEIVRLTKFEFFDEKTRTALKLALYNAIEHNAMNRTLWENVNGSNISTPNFSITQDQSNWLLSKDMLGIKSDLYLTQAELDNYEWLSKDTYFHPISSGGNVRVMGRVSIDDIPDLI